MSLRKIGRWLYHVVTSSEKRPYIDLALPALGEEVTRASTGKEVFKLLGIFDELTYRITSAAQRDFVKRRISELLLRFEHEELSPDSTRNEVNNLRILLLQKYAEAAAAEAEAKREAEEKTRLAAAEKARKEAEAKAKLEKERLAAEEKARQQAVAEAIRAAKEEARQVAEVEKARLEAEAEAKREAEEKTRLAAAEKARKEAEAQQMPSTGKSLTDFPTRLQDKADKKLTEDQSRRKDLAEQIRKFIEARPIISPEIAISESESTAEQKAHLQSDAETTRLAEYVTQAKKVEEVLLEVEVKEYKLEEADVITAAQIKDISAQDDLVGSDAESYTITARRPEELSRKAITKSVSREEKREERRQLARLRILEREEKAEDQSVAEELAPDEEYEFEQAEEFAQYLRSVPAHWTNWSEQHWNIKLLHYCFVQKANEGRGRGIPSTEEDLVIMTGDRESSPIEIAQALVDRVREFSINHGSSPARLLIKRLETWDHKSSSPPRFFAFLWTTCLIAQGFPSSFEQGEFHRRYERDDVYGANERQYLSWNLPNAWIQLSKWLNRIDIFDGHGHRRLDLPQTDPNRSIISYSWKLSFPCRADRKRLYDVLERAKRDNRLNGIIDKKLISRIYYEGGFTPEFTVALEKQIELLDSGSHTEEWLSAIIQRELAGLEASAVQLRRQVDPKSTISRSPKIELYIDEEDCYLELVLPSQLVAIENTSHISQNACCTISLQNETISPLILSKFDIDSNQEELLIPEIRDKITKESDEYILSLCHQGLDNVAIVEWSCEGLASGKPYIIFDSETNEILKSNAEIGRSLSLLYRHKWNIATSDGIDAEDSIRVSRLGNWSLLLLTKTSPPETCETISVTNVSGESFAIHWDSSGNSGKNSRPLLEGLSLPGQANLFVLLEENPELWMPPTVVDANIKIFRIKDEEFYIPVGSIEISSTGIWKRAGVRKFITCPGHYSIKIKYYDSSSVNIKKWSKNIRVAEELDTRSLKPMLLQAKYGYAGMFKVLDLEMNVSPFIFGEPQEFWNAMWQIYGLWPYEKIRVRLNGDREDYSHLLSADSSGNCELPVAIFEPYLISRQSARLSIQRLGFSCQYDLAILDGSTNRADQNNLLEPVRPPVASSKRTAQRRRMVDRLELVVYGTRNFAVQSIIINKLENAISVQFGDLDSRSTEYPEGKYAQGKRFVCYRVDLADIDNEIKEKLVVAMDSLVNSVGSKSGLTFGAEWRRARE